MNERRASISAEHVKSALLADLDVDELDELDSLLIAEAILILEGLGLVVDDSSLVPPVTVKQVLDAAR